LHVPVLTDEEKIDALNSISIDDLKKFSNRLLSQVEVVVLSHGNLTEKETLIKLPEKSGYSKKLDLNHSDSSIAIYRQGIDRNRGSRARYALLRQLISQPFYAELRTRQQLGYFVFTFSIDSIQVPSVVLALQSPATDTRQYD